MLLLLHALSLAVHMMLNIDLFSCTVIHTFTLVVLHTMVHMLVHVCLHDPQQL